MTQQITVSIVGGSGYAGGELLRILLLHPKVSIKQVTSRNLAGERVSLAHPNLRKVTDLVFSHPSQLEDCDVLFVALPNTVSMQYMEEFKKKAKKIIDLGADFRLHSSKEFKKWYQKDHLLPDFLANFVYGLAEIQLEKLRKANFVACGGCEATVSILSLYPRILSYGCKQRLHRQQFLLQQRHV